MENLLSLRFENRDIAFEKKLKSIKEEHTKRGILYSEDTVERAHVALEAELSGSRNAIVTTICESLPTNNSEIVAREKIDKGIELLRNRKDYLESFYLETLKPVSAMFQDREMIESYTKLSDAIRSNEVELRVDLANGIEEYLCTQRDALYNRFITLFANKPLVVFSVIGVAVVAAALLM